MIHPLRTCGLVAGAVEGCLELGVNAVVDVATAGTATGTAASAAATRAGATGAGAGAGGGSTAAAGAGDGPSAGSLSGAETWSGGASAGAAEDVAGAPALTLSVRTRTGRMGSVEPTVGGAVTFAAPCGVGSDCSEGRPAGAGMLSVLATAKRRSDAAFCSGLGSGLCCLPSCLLPSCLLRWPRSSARPWPLSLCRTLRPTCSRS